MVRKRVSSDGPEDAALPTEEASVAEPLETGEARVDAPAWEPDLADTPRDPLLIEATEETPTKAFGAEASSESPVSAFEAEASSEPPTTPADTWPAAEPIRPSVAAPPPRRGGAGPLLMGGALAAALGFGAAWVARGPDGSAGLPPEVEERLAALESRPLPEGADTEPLAARLEEAEARLAALEEAGVPAADLAPLQEEVAAAAAQAEERAEERAAALEERLAALEARPEPAAPASAGSLVPAEGPDSAPSVPTLEPRLAEAESALGGVREEVGALASRLDDIEARLAQAEEAGAAAVAEAQAAQAALQESQAQTAAAEAEARRGAALAALGAALDQGTPFEGELAALGAEPSEALARAAAGGVPTLASLREEFPEAARAALAAAREAGLADSDGLWGAARSFLSVRSTAPREGEDPDAILSRAEAALAQGRLDEALAELAALPEPARTALADWTAGAEARAAAMAAIEALRASPEPAVSAAD